MTRTCLRPHCSLRRADGGPHCECGAATRESVHLRVEALHGGHPVRWDFARAGVITVGRGSRGNASSPPDIDLAQVMSDASAVSRQLLTVTWSGAARARVSRGGERGSVEVDGAPLAPRMGRDLAIPFRVVVNESLELRFTTEEA